MVFFTAKHAVRPPSIHGGPRKRPRKRLADVSAGAEDLATRKRTIGTAQAGVWVLRCPVDFHGETGHPFFGWLTLKGLPKKKETRAPLGNRGIRGTNQNGGFPVGRSLKTGIPQNKTTPFVWVFVSLLLKCQQQKQAKEQATKNKDERGNERTNEPMSKQGSKQAKPTNLIPRQQPEMCGKAQDSLVPLCSILRHPRQAYTVSKAPL